MTNVVGQSGSLVISLESGAILNSAGDLQVRNRNTYMMKDLQTFTKQWFLQNDEKTANTIYGIVKSTGKLEKTKTISISHKKYSFVIVLSGNKIHVVKRESQCDA